MESKLLKHFNSETPNADIELTNSDIQKELTNILHTENDYLFTLYALEKLPHRFNYEQAALSQLRLSPKYAIYNLRILKLLKSDIRYTTHVLKIMKSLKAETKENCSVDMNRLKVGSDTARTIRYVQFVTRKCLKLLVKYLKSVSNSVGFPEIAYWVIKELKMFEGANECIMLIEKQKKYVEEMRKGVKVFEKQSVTRLESEMVKIDHQ